MSYISQKIYKRSQLLQHVFNLVTAGCGTGKSQFVLTYLTKLFPEVLPCEIVYVTSRSMTAEQQSIEYENAVLLDYDELPAYAAFINGAAAQCTDQDKIHIMTYDKLGTILHEHKVVGHALLQNAKIIVIDECHALISDDSFMQHIRDITCTLHGLMMTSDTIVIGLTATPDILLEDTGKLGYVLHQVLDEPIYRFKAKHLYVAREGSLPHFLDQKRFPGISIVLCSTAKEAEDLAQKYPNSAWLVSPSNKKAYIKETMDPLRRAITHGQRLPSECMVQTSTGVEKRKIEILFTTTTLREGVNLCEHSGITNVISLITDKLHVIQFVGRCRFNVENLIVIDTKAGTDDEAEGYMAREHAGFRALVNCTSNDWLRGMENIVSCALSEVVYIGDTSDETDKFCRYIDKYALTTAEREVPLTSDLRSRVEKTAQKYGLCARYGVPKNFINVRRVMEEHLGYTFETIKGTKQNNRKQYQIITKKENK